MKWQLRQLAIVAAMVLAGCATTLRISRIVGADFA
jgi:hypothetical protein